MEHRAHQLLNNWCSVTSTGRGGGSSITWRLEPEASWGWLSPYPQSGHISMWCCTVWVGVCSLRLAPFWSLARLRRGFFSELAWSLDLAVLGLTKEGGSLRYLSSCACNWLFAANAWASCSLRMTTSARKAITSSSQLMPHTISWKLPHRNSGHLLSAAVSTRLCPCAIIG